MPSASQPKKKRFVNVVGPIVTPPRSNHFELFEELLPPSAVPRAGGWGGCCLPLERSARVSDSLTLISTPNGAVFLTFDWHPFRHCRWNWSLSAFSRTHFGGKVRTGLHILALKIMMSSLCYCHLYRSLFRNSFQRTQTNEGQTTQVPRGRHGELNE